MKIRELRLNEATPMELLLMADPSRELVESYLGNGYCYVAETGSQIVGIYVLLPTTSDTIELVNIAVVESQQGKGIGQLLVKHAIENAKTNGYKAVEVGTGNSSTNQLALYQKCGFIVTGIDKDYFVRNYPEAIFENGIQCRDMIRLTHDLTQA
ncbi:MAG: GNAT family N-acetyltransferase [Negativicutes bacterium]|jgi:ribosomal protein S18 acetylase RimI-like enzyme